MSIKVVDLQNEEVKEELPTIEEGKEEDNSAVINEVVEEGNDEEDKEVKKEIKEEEAQVEEIKEVVKPIRA